jgi:hypothetical protein
MPKMIVYTDAEGRILGAVRADPIETDRGTIQFQAPPGETDTATSQFQGRQRADVRPHELDVPEDLLQGSVEELQKELQTRVTSRPK